MKTRLKWIILTICTVITLFPNVKVKAGTSADDSKIQLNISYTDSYGYIKLTWSSDKKAAGYRIYKKAKGSSYGTFYKEVNGTEYIDKKAKDGTTYYYKVRAYYENDDKTLFGEYSNEVNGYRFCLDGKYTLDQRKDAPNGCELYSLSLLLKYHGIDVDPLTLCAKINTESTPYWSNGIRYGGNPNRGYLAPSGCDASSASGWGVYKDPILNLAKKYKEEGLTDLTGSSLDEILDFVKENGAVEVWGTMYNEPVRRTNNKWTDHKTGKQVVWKSDMHAMVIVGYTKKSIIVSDPLKNKIVTYDREMFESNYEWLNKQAVGYSCLED